MVIILNVQTYSLASLRKKYETHTKIPAVYMSTVAPTIVSFLLSFSPHITCIWKWYNKGSVLGHLPSLELPFNKFSVCFQIAFGFRP